MPDWNVYYDSGSVTSTSSSSYSTWYPEPRTATQIQQEYEEWKQECERQDRIQEQMMREAEEQCYQEMRQARELEEDKKRYPLFFLKEGIV